MTGAEQDAKDAAARAEAEAAETARRTASVESEPGPILGNGPGGCRNTRPPRTNTNPH
jgi:hypothetical protein